jgi:hypothetical protein
LPDFLHIEATDKLLVTAVLGYHPKEETRREGDRDAELLFALDPTDASGATPADEAPMSEAAMAELIDSIRQAVSPERVQGRTFPPGLVAGIPGFRALLQQLKRFPAVHERNGFVQLRCADAFVSFLGYLVHVGGYRVTVPASCSCLLQGVWNCWSASSAGTLTTTMT